MATITINLSDDLLEDAQEKLAPYHRTVEDYLIGVLYELRDDPQQKVFTLDVQDEAMIEEGLRSPSVQVDEAFWQRLRDHAERFRLRTGT
jgi:hypothetical protein